MSRQNTNIVKRSGEVVPFDENKLIQSLEQSGASQSDIDYIVDQVRNKLVEGMTTRKLYQLAYSILRKKSHRSAGKYRLKKAIFDLGPTGYPFERFVGALLQNQGFRVEVGKIIQGKCVTHEVDVVAVKDDRKFMIECKFHSDPGRKSDVKVSLYIHSRFLDIEEQWKKQPKENGQFHQGWIVTNTRFTQDALQFGKCAGLKLISWDYPSKRSLKQMIDQSGLHPVTALQSLKKREKQLLLEKDIVLCRDVTGKNLEAIGIHLTRIPAVLKEVTDIIATK